MFDIGWNELLVIVMVAVVVIGPKDLPRVLRMVGQWTGKLKRMGREFQGQFNEALREAELDEVRKDIVAIGTGLKEEVAKTGADINKGLQVPEPVVSTPEPAPVTASPVEAAPAFETLPTDKSAPAVEAPPPAEAPTPVPEPAETVAPQPEPAAVAAGEVKP